MTEPTRYSGRYGPASGRRSPVYNPGRASLPVGVNYTQYADPYAPDPYGGDIHVMPVSHHDGMMPIRAPGDYRTNSIPVTTTTYAVKKEREPGGSAVSRSTSVRDGSASGSRHRSSTLDSSKRPPIIITTKHDALPSASSSHAAPNTRSDSPSRDPYRTSEEHYYAQPGTSIHRARSTNRAPAAPYSSAFDNDDYARLKERTGEDRLRAGAYRPPREPPIYSYESRHGGAAVDIGNEGYEYTKPSDLARYDLDTTRAPRHGRRDSFDQGYYRGSGSGGLSTDSVGGRPYEQNDRRTRGPPPTSRGLDKVNRAVDAGIYDAPSIRMPPLPAAPHAPPRSGLLSPEIPSGERRSTSRTRPVSLYQERGDPRGSYYPRDPRDKDYFIQDDVTTRGFGLRIDPKDADVRRETREPEHRRRDVDDIRREPLREPEPRRRDDYEPREADLRRREPKEDDVIARREAREGREPESKRRDERSDKREPYIEERDPRDRDARRTSGEDFEPVRRRDERKEYVDVEPPSRTRDDRKMHDERSPRRRSDEEWEFIPRKDDRRDARESRSSPEIRISNEDPDRRSRRDDAPVRDRRERERDSVERVDDDRGDKKDKLKEKVTAGLGIAAAAIGLGSAFKDKDGKDSRDDRKEDRKESRKEDRPSPRDSRDSDDLRSWEDGADDLRPSDGHRSSRRDVEERRPSSKDDIEIIERPRDRDVERSRREKPSDPSDDTRRRDRRAAEVALTGEALDRPSRDTSTSSADATSSRPRRRVRASGFNPNDTGDLEALKAQLAARESQDRPERSDTKAERSERLERSERSERPDRLDRPERTSPPIRDTSAERRSPTTEEADKFALVRTPKDDDLEHGRDLIVPPAGERQVRVVSPPRDKDDKKPVKGILKPPKPQFPEEPNPVREGVAPHKTDKTKADVPPGARWTKINRSLVNPDALTIGKERFEVRDDFVIVLRVLSKEEIQAYATATAQLREMKRAEYEKKRARRDHDEPVEDEDRRRRHRHQRRERDDEPEYDERERDGHRRSRRHRQHEIEGEDGEEEERPKAIEYHGHGSGHHRSHRAGE